MSVDNIADDKLNNMKFHFPAISLIIFTSNLICYSNNVLSEEIHNICFNFTIITKKTEHDETEAKYYKEQIIKAKQQIKNTQTVFDNNHERSCPKVKFEIGEIKQIEWNQALNLSRPIEQERNETSQAYEDRVQKNAFKHIQNIAKKLKQQPDIKYYDFLKLKPAKAIVNAEKVIGKLNNNINNVSERTSLEHKHAKIAISIKLIKEKLDSYGIEEKGALLKRAENTLNKYELIDRVSAESWHEGILVFWNDVEAQDSSIEVKNLLNDFAITKNKCLNVYFVPKGKSPSRTQKEINKNGKWTTRGGAALPEKIFPRTTAGKGHAIILTQDVRKTENRLAHELGHLLIDMPDAHFGKEAKDLMHEKSLGGNYLNKEECKKINENIKTFKN